MSSLCVGINWSPLDHGARCAYGVKVWPHGSGWPSWFHCNSWQTSFTFQFIRDLPQSRAKAIAIGQLDPTTMRSFDLLPSRMPTTPSVSKSPDMDFFQAHKRESSKMPQMEPLRPFATGGFEGPLDVPPHRTTTPISTSNSPDMEFIQAHKRDFFKKAQMELLQPCASRVLEESQVRFFFFHGKHQMRNEVLSNKWTPQILG